MTRLLPAWLLLLAACASQGEKDPEGTLAMGANPYYTKGDSIVIAAGSLGDSRYFRLPAATVSFTLTEQPKTDYTLLRGCAVKVELKSRTGELVKELYDKANSPSLETIRVNISNPDVYYLSFESDYSFCVPIVIIEKA